MLLDLTDMLFRHAWRIAAIAALTVCVALVYNAVNGPLYTATLRVLVTPGAGADAGAPVVQDHGQTARNQAELLADPGLIHTLVPALQDARPAAAVGFVERLVRRVGDRWREVAERLGLILPADAQERFAARLSRALAVSAVGDTDVIRLDFTWNDRAFAADTLNRILAGYQRTIAGAHEARETLGLAEARLADAQTELKGLDARLAAAQAGEDAGALGRDRRRLRAELDAARRSADGLRLDRELAGRKLAAADQAYKDGGWVDDPSVQQTGQQTGPSRVADSFAALLKKRQDLMVRAQPDRVRIAAVDAQIAAVRAQNYEAVRRLCAAEIASLGDRLAAAGAGIADDETALRGLETGLAEADVLARARDAGVARVGDATRRVEAARARIDAVWQEVGSTRVLSAARPPVQPDWPAPPLLLEIAAMAGLAAGFGAAVLAERGRRLIDRPMDISRRLGIDVLARLDDIKRVPLR